MEKKKKKKLITFSEIDLFDASNLTLTFNKFDAFDGGEHELGANVVGVKDQGFEHPIWGHTGFKSLSDSGQTHDWFLKTNTSLIHQREFLDQERE